ncbi:hypothetical protein CAPTEDRAFT_184957 [Capitella teleta]|uniref:Endonuclease/exonuclease/phosphatase domain-containing protein n=1 Tax=Capitella teleta TaxID=283909 RepID=R7UFS7_CAPTE|nr:hypothetical protein CAPTEDRAFT_184957 [Capitella teleta]|eukprot:ELU04953.1 hypothetical protein CAPTEDRAFT_184957 [Capitella teleta]
MDLKERECNLIIFGMKEEDGAEANTDEGETRSIIDKVDATDSPYHSFAPFSEIQERVNENDDEKFILIGDLNARFGNERTAFIEVKNFPMPTHYAPSPDPVTSTNVNARCAIGSLRNSFVLLNGLCSGGATHKTALTFRQRSRWISELDTLFASSELLLPLISDFEIHQKLELSSDHAAISCCIALNRLECSRNIQPLMDIAEKLGRPSTQQDPLNNVFLHQRRMIKMSQIDPQLAANTLNITSPLDFTLDDTDTIVDEVNNLFYNIASNARITTSPAAQKTDADVKWKDLLENNDSCTIWKAVNWNGSIASPEKEDRPNDDAFRVHFEELLNSVNEQTNFLSNFPNHPVHLPATDDPIRPSEVLEATQTLKTSKSGGPSGCGTTMVRTLAVIYKTTKMILRSATKTASVGVRQGSPTSCLLFTLLVNDMIRILKEKCQPDEYLEWMHVLMLMDVTC